MPPLFRPLILLFAFVTLAFGQTGLTRLGEFAINSTTSGNQTAPIVASDAEGNFVVVWNSAGQDGSGLGVYARRYNSAGSPLSDEFRVNETTADDQGSPAVAMASGGRFVVAWSSRNQQFGETSGAYSIYARRYLADGTAAGGEFPVNSPSSASADQQHPSVAMNAAGDFVIAWSSDGQAGTTSPTILFQRYNAAGSALGGETIASGPGTVAREPGISMNDSGDFVVVWRQNAQDVLGRTFNADGTPKKPITFEVKGVTLDAGNTHDYPSVVLAADGSFVVAWHATGADGDGTGIRAQRFQFNSGDAEGVARVGAEIAVNTSTAGNQIEPNVELNPAGGFVVVWRSASGDGSGDGVSARSFAADGTAAESEFVVNTITTGAQRPNPTHDALAFDQNGNFVVVWDTSAVEGDFGIRAEKFFQSNQGPPLSEFRVNAFSGGDQDTASVASDSAGNFVIVWESYGEDGSGEGIYWHLYDPSGRTLAGPTRANSETSNDQANPAVAMSPSGAFVIVWEDKSSVGSSRLKGQRYDLGGTPRGGNFDCFTSTSAIASPAVAMGGNDRFVVVRRAVGEPHDSSEGGIIAQKFVFSSGITDGGQYGVNDGDLNMDQAVPSIAMNAAGAYVIVWRSWDTNGTGVNFRLVQANGTDTGVRPVSAAANQQGDQSYSSVAMANDGSFVVVFDSEVGNQDIRAARFDAQGTRLEDDFPLNLPNAGDQFYPSVSLMPDGGFLAVYRSAGFDGNGFGVALRRRLPNGTLQPEVLVNSFVFGDQVVSAGGAIAIDALGNYVVVWQSPGQDGSGYGVYATKVFLYPEVTITAQDASPVADTTATLNGTVNAHGDTATVSFDYGTTAALGTTVAVNNVTGTSDTPVSTMLTGLLPGQTIYFRVRASSSGREVVGETRSFTTTIVPPLVSLPVQTAQGLTTASLEVTVNPKGTATTVLLEYRLEPPVNVNDPFTATAAQDCGSGQGDQLKTFNLTGLTASRTYKVRAKATNSQNMTAASADTTFTTTGAPGVVTGGTADLTKTTATLLGTVNPFGTETTAIFEYGLTASYGLSTPVQSIGMGTTATAVQATIGVLEPNTEYHYRLVGTNGAGSTNGNDATFRTLEDPPIVATGEPGNVSNTGATLQGAVDTKGRATSYYFEWGTTMLYGIDTPVQNLSAGLVTTQNVSAVLPGVLTPGATYHYRIVATNAGGTARGGNVSFVAQTGGGGPGASDLPTITSPGFSGVDRTSVFLTATVNPNGGTTGVIFRYGTSPTFNAATWSEASVPDIGGGNSAVPVSKQITGLSPATTYYFRVDATNSLGTRMLDGGSFTTANPPAPDVTNVASSNVGQTTATLSARVTANGGPTAVRFEYGIDAGMDTNYTGQTATENLLASAANQQVSKDVSGLTPGTTYRFRVVATNAGGTTQPEGTFTTEAPPPTVTNLMPNPLGATFVTLRAKVNPNGKSTMAYFEYGTTTSYGIRTLVQSLGSGNEDTEITAALTGLLPATDYHFRVVATSTVVGDNMTEGADGTFRTSDPAAPIAEPDVIFTTRLRENNATINVLANDVDPDTGVAATGLVLDEVSGQQSPTRGTITQNSNGNVTYRALNGFDPDGDSFNYTVKKQNAPTLMAQGTVRVLSFVRFEGFYADVFRATVGSTAPTGGALSCKMNKLGAGTLRLNWLGKDYNDKVVLDAAGRATADLPKIGFPPGTVLHLDLQLVETGEINVTLTDHQTPTDAGQQYFATLLSAGSGGANVTAGVHNGFFDPGPSSGAAEARAERGASATSGFGFNIATISKSKRGRFIGRVPDFAKFSKGSVAPVQNRYTVNPGLYRFQRVLRGILLGQVDLGGVSTTTSFSSDFQWRQDAVAEAGFAGFDRRLILGGELYRGANEPSSLMATIIFGADRVAQVRFEGGGLSGGARVANATIPLATALRGGGPLTVTGGPPELKLRMQFSVGRYNGSFTHPDTNSKSKFEGVLRRRPDSLDPRRGAGAFKSEDGNTGTVTVLPIGS